MSGTEFLVVVFGLFIGYWIVSQFGSGSRSRPEQTRCPKDAKASPHEKHAAGWQEGQADQDEASVPWHEILNVAPDAGAEEIRRAYQSLMSQYHPDKVAALGPELRELCERKSKEINAAYTAAIVGRGVS